MHRWVRFTIALNELWEFTWSNFSNIIIYLIVCTRNVVTVKACTETFQKLEFFLEYLSIYLYINIFIYIYMYMRMLCTHVHVH